MKICDFIKKSAIIKELKGKDKKSVIVELVESAKQANKDEKIKVVDVIDLLMKREKIGSTGIGNKMAIPHVKVEGVKSVVGAFGRSVSGIDFKAIDGELVHLIFIVFSPLDDPGTHLQALRRIAKATKQPNFLRFLQDAKDVNEIYGLFKEFDEVLK